MIIMTLDDVIKYGKKASRAEALTSKAREGENVALELANLDEIGRDDPVAYGILREASLDYTPARQEQKGLEYIAVRKPQAIGAVQSDVQEAINGISKDDVLRNYLLQRKPVKYTGVSDELFKVHEDAFKAHQTLTDEQKLNEEAGMYMNKSLTTLKGKDVSDSILATLQKLYAGGKAVEVVRSKAMEKIGAFNAKFARDVALKYAFERYGSLTDPDKAKEAYEIAKAVGASN